MIENYLVALPIIYIVVFIIATFLKKIFPNFLDPENPFFCTVCLTFASTLIISFMFDLFPRDVLIFLLGVSFLGIAKKLDEYLYWKDVDFPGQFFILTLLMTMLGLLIIKYYIPV